jgi:hypothetical protein
MMGQRRNRHNQSYYLFFSTLFLTMSVSMVLMYPAFRPRGRQTECKGEQSNSVVAHVGP